MTLLCSIAGHSADTSHRHNQGFDFAICHHCGCDLIRTALGDWTPVPRGMRVVWREPARFGDMPLDAIRRAPRRPVRNARAIPHRDRRGRPFEGVAAMFGILANLGRLVGGDMPHDVPGKPSSAKPFRLH